MDEAFRKKLDRMFSPRSVVVLGAGVTPDKVGHAIMDSLVTGRLPRQNISDPPPARDNFRFTRI